MDRPSMPYNRMGRHLLRTDCKKCIRISVKTMFRKIKSAFEQPNCYKLMAPKSEIFISDLRG